MSNRGNDLVDFCDNKIAHVRLVAQNSLIKGRIISPTLDLFVGEQAG
jgi:hypothetical protein